MSTELIVQLVTNVGVVGTVLLVFLLRVWPQMMADHNKTVSAIVNQNNAREEAMRQAFQSELAAFRAEVSTDRETYYKEMRQMAQVLSELVTAVTIHNQSSGSS